MYREDQIKAALELYHQCGSVTKTIRLLGYPSRRALYGWINNEGKPKEQRKKSKLIHTKEHPLNPSVEVKIDALRRCFEWRECKISSRRYRLYKIQYFCLAKKVSSRGSSCTDE